MFGIKINGMVDFVSVVNTMLIASSQQKRSYLQKTVLARSKAKDEIIKSVPTWHKKQITTNGTYHYTMPCIYTAREVHLGMLFGS